LSCSLSVVEPAETPYAAPVDDPHRQPRDQDRNRLTTRIKRAADEGRIGAADRDIRLRNVAAAHSMAELDLMARELDQLESALAAGAAVSTWAGPPQQSAADELADKAHDVARSTARSVGVVSLLILAVVIAAAGAVAFFAVGGSKSGSATGGSELLDPSPIVSTVPVPSTEPGTSPEATTPSVPAYSLTGPGIRAFLDLYRSTYDTTEVVDLVLYDDYVIVSVPVPGKARHGGLLYRNDSGFTDFGGIRANAPGTRTIDVATMNIRALLRNIERARATLNVEDPTTTYVVIRHFASSEAPDVNIYVSNEFRESGYLATTMKGQVERAYPYSP
jgi:hypothetical protein